MLPKKKSVGILGGSFDPVHYGHLSIAQSFLDSEYISELWILLTPESPHKSRQKTAPYSLRFQMLEGVFNAYEDITVSNVEQQLSPPYYSVQTLEYLTDRYDDQSFFLCMGEDSLINFHKWHRWKELLALCNLLVAARPQYQPDQLSEEIAQQTYYVDHQPIDISSSQIRKRIKKNEDISGLVSTKVAQIITQNSLYKD